MPAVSGPVPGLTRIDHVGITVPDLDQAHDFFTGVLGCEYMSTSRRMPRTSAPESASAD